MFDVTLKEIFRFSIIYILLVIILLIMKKCKIKETKLLFIASMKMSAQLIIAGFILTYIIKKPNPLYIIVYILAMVAFANFRVLSKNKDINKNFKIAISLSLSLSGICIAIFFVTVITGKNIFNPQYIIPLSGMIIGNAMTGVNLGVKSFKENLRAENDKITALLNLGVRPKKILLPFVNQSIETALLPTMNSMLGMGIVSLPGMMTGQIIAGTLPTTAILYQISIMIAISAVVCLSVFLSLYFGYKSLYNKKNQINF